MVQDVIEETEIAHANGVRANGKPVNGKLRGGALHEEDSDQTNENIFLFIPNLIGK